jgi:hypothetical protein
MNKITSTVAIEIMIKKKQLLTFISLFYSSFCLAGCYQFTVDDQPPLHFHYHAKKKNSPDLSYTETIPLTTPDGASFNAYYLNNKSDKLIVFGHGFRNSHKDMEKTAALFADQGYDLVLFDYRWAHKLLFHTLQKEHLSDLYNGLMTKQKQEIITVVNHMKSIKNYKAIIGLGQCYSAYLFTLCQADATIEGQSLFTHLILDSCFYSISTLIKQIISDPFLCRDSKRGGFPQAIRKIFIHDPGIWIVSKALEICGKEYPLKQSLQVIQETPTLFIHGVKDKLVQKKELKKIWNYKQGPKALFETPFAHVQNKKAGELYALVCNHFIEYTNKQPITLHDVEKLPGIQRPLL